VRLTDLASLFMTPVLTARRKHRYIQLRLNAPEDPVSREVFLFLHKGFHVTFPLDI